MCTTTDEFHLEILGYFCTKNSNYTRLNPSRTSSEYIVKHQNELSLYFKYLDNYAYCKDISLQEKLYLIANDLVSPCLCSTCGKETKFLSYAKGYAKHCSKKCSCDDPHNKESYYSTIAQQRIKRHPELACDLTCHNDDADKYISRLFILSSGNFDGNKCNMSKRWCQKHANYVNYIVNRYTDSSDIQENVYRLTHDLNTLPKCQVCGKPAKYINFVKGYSKTCSHKCAHNTKEYHEKIKNSMINKYGVEYPMQSDIIREKAYNTFINRLTTGYYLGGNSEISNYASSSELLVFNTLKPLYPDILQYYKDTRYSNPHNGRLWECDFYIPSLDLFIEVQGFRTHGSHAYNKHSLDDIKYKEQLRYEAFVEKKTFSKCILNTWTKKDVFKRYIAKSNGIKLLELYQSDLVEDRIIKLVQSVS